MNYEDSASDVSIMLQAQLAVNQMTPLIINTANQLNHNPSDSTMYQLIHTSSYSTTDQLSHSPSDIMASQLSRSSINIAASQLSQTPSDKMASQLSQSSSDIAASQLSRSCSDTLERHQQEIANKRKPN